MSVARDVVRRRIDPRRHQGNHGHHRRRQPDPGRGSGRRESRAAEGADRPDGAARVQAGRPLGQSAGRPAGPRAAGQPGAADGRRRRRHRGQAPGDGFGRPADGRHQGFDQDGRPDIEITFNTAGARRFARATQENVGKPFAIILDDKVLSAPNINEPILGGNAQITGSFTVQSAHDLAVSLASGKLPVKLNVIEERTRRPRPRQGFDPQGRDRQRSSRCSA